MLCFLLTQLNLMSECFLILVYRIYNGSVIYYILNVFCARVVRNGTKEIKSKSHS